MGRRAQEPIIPNIPLTRSVNVELIASRIYYDDVDDDADDTDHEDDEEDDDDDDDPHHHHSDYSDTELWHDEYQWTTLQWV